MRLQYLAVSTSMDGSCVLHSSTIGTTVTYMIAGEIQLFMVHGGSHSNHPSDSDTATASHCKGSQLVGMYHYPRPGEEQKPYDAVVADFFNAAITLE